MMATSASEQPGSEGQRHEEKDAKTSSASTSTSQEMKVELNLSWFTKRDKPLISIKPRKDSSSSSSTSKFYEENM